MKTLKVFSFIAFFMAIASFSFAQTKTETFKVSGNCGMCKTSIEKAAKAAGATEASWDKETKELTVTYNSSTSNTAKIQQQIAGVGYDNAGFKATDASYKKLPGCCKYDRAAATAEKEEHMCSDKCEMKDGKCVGHDGKMDCCKDGKCSKEGHDGKDCCKKDGEKMDCCKDGKCSKPGHDGKDCCKKS